MDILASTVVKNARSFLNVNWRHCGRSKEQGIDCVGLIICTFNASGTDVKAFADYTKYDEFRKLVRIVNDYCNKIKDKTDIKEADILMFRGRDMYNHIGIYLGDNTFIHSYSMSAVRKVVITPYDGYWKMRLKGLYRYKDIVYE